MADDAYSKKIAEKLKGSNDVAQFAALGKELLKQTNRPNVITLEQFEPYIELFKVDKTRYIANYHDLENAPPNGNDEPYTRRINALYTRFIRELNINIHEVTYVIKSQEDREIIYYLNRTFTRIQSGNVEGESARDKIPTNIPRSAIETQDNLVLNATWVDVRTANMTESQRKEFVRQQMESIIVNRRFVQNNQTPELRPDAVTPTSSTPDTEVVEFRLVDDDD